MSNLLTLVHKYIFTKPCHQDDEKISYEICKDIIFLEEEF